MIKPKILCDVSGDNFNKILEIYNKNLIDMKTIIAHYQFKKFCFYFFFGKFIKKKLLFKYDIKYENRVREFKYI